MSSHSYELARKHAGGLALLSAPVRTSWELADLASADGHLLRVMFHASLRTLDEPTERKMLEEVFLSERPAVTVAQANAHFLPTLHSMAERAVKGKSAEHWLADAGRNELCDLLRKSAGEIGFACGLDVIAPIRLELDSPTLTQQQLQAMHRTLAEQQAAGRVEHFQKAVDLLQKLESQRGAVATTGVTKAIESLNPADRGAMLKTLLLAGSSKSVSTVLFAVAGTSLVHVKLDSPSTPIITELPATLGPFRSIQAATIDDRLHWLIGARDGVFVVPADDLNAAATYRDGGVESQQGFSRVLVRNGVLMACHSDAGLVSWNLGQGERPAKMWRPTELSGVPRHLHSLGATSYLFALGGQLAALTREDAVQRLATSSTNIVAIVPDDHRFIIVYEDGTLRALERATRSLITLEHRGQRIASATGLSWLGGQRLLLAGDDGTIDCVGIEDDLLTQYGSPHRGVRRVIASTSHVAALTGDRTRVVIWHSWDGKTPALEIPFARVTPHRVADLCLA